MECATGRPGSPRAAGFFVSLRMPARRLSDRGAAGCAVPRVDAWRLDRRVDGGEHDVRQRSARSGPVEASPWWRAGPRPAVTGVRNACPFGTVQEFEWRSVTRETAPRVSSAG